MSELLTYYLTCLLPFFYIALAALFVRYFPLKWVKKQYQAYKQMKLKKKEECLHDWPEEINTCPETEIYFLKCKKCSTTVGELTGIGRY